MQRAIKRLTLPTNFKRGKGTNSAENNEKKTLFFQLFDMQLKQIRFENHNPNKRIVRSIIVKMLIHFLVLVAKNVQKQTPIPCLLFNNFRV